MTIPNVEYVGIIKHIAMDKLEKVKAEIERRKKLHEKSLINPIHEGFGLQNVIKAKISELTYLSSFIDSMQEECNITSIKSKHATGKLKECIDNVSEESLAKAHKQLQEELVNGGLDLGCGVIWKDEKSESGDLEKVVEEIVDPTVLNAYGVKEIANRLRRTMIEPVSEDLEKVSFDNAQKNYKEGFRGTAMQAFNEGAEWQKQKDESYTKSMYKVGINTGKELMKQQLMAKAVDAVVKVDAGGYPYIDRTIELYDYDKDIPLAKRGDKYKVILIKED